MGGEPAPDAPAFSSGVVDALTEAIRARRQGQSTPVLVALDGRSATGKSTLAGLVGHRLGALVIDSDDFYRGGTDAYWDAMEAAQKMDLVIDWARQQAVLERLHRREAATWRPYDWEVDDGSLADEFTGGPAEIVILEGAYSARPELAGLLSLRVLLQLPREVRRKRLLQREGEQYRAEWEARWGVAEDLYFERVMPPEAFDLVLEGS
jgi:uridine kinase